jgi:CRISPR type IV-associated protein Csf2
MSHYRLHGLFTLRSPLSHIGESISTQTFLIEEPIIQPDGKLEPVFAYNGNAWRGALRDHAASYLLDRLTDDNGNAARVPLDIFHLLFTGGRIGGDQSINIQQARKVRAVLPMLAMWGGGVGNQIMAGKLRVSSAYPLCLEAIPVLPERWHNEAAATSYADVTFEKSFSRMDDTKREDMQKYLPPADVALLEGDGNAKKKNKAGGEVADQMRMTTELVAPGVRLYQEIDVLDASEVEIGALVSAIHSWSRSPHLGGQANKGHGKCRLDYRILDMDTGEEKDFIRVIGDGPCLLAASAQAAKDAYDQHLRRLYDQLLESKAGDIRGLIGAI